MTDKLTYEELRERVASLERHVDRLNRTSAQRADMEVLLRRSEEYESIVTLAGGIAHDFNNILFPIIGYTEMVMGDESRNGSRAYLTEVLKAANRAKALVRQLLTFSRQSLQDVSPVSIQAVIGEAMEIRAPSLPGNIDLVLRIDEVCQPVLADAEQIHEIIANLWTNACQAMESRGGTLCIGLSSIDVGEDGPETKFVLATGTYLELSVSDTGIGMDQAVLDRVFNPYFTTRPPGEGIGLGLSVVLGVVKSHGGDIQISSRPGEGTEVRVYLPVPTHGVRGPLSVSSLTAPRGQERVLLVDDEKPIALMCQKMLARLGYLVTVANDSIEALHIFEAAPEKFDVVVIDRTMPKMDGPKLAGELARIRSNVPMILCTAFSERISPEQAKELGFQVCIMKPVVRSELAGAIRQALELSRVES